MKLNLFSNEQLKEVKKLDLAAILCAVAHDMTTVPRDPFYLGDHVDCSSIDMPDFSKWTAASAPKHSLFSCPFDSASGLLNCNRKNWSEAWDDLFKIMLLFLARNDMTHSY